MSCQNNNGGAGTLYDTIPKSLTVNNQNLSTESDTLLMDFPKKSLWTNVFVKDRAKVAVPLPWSRVQVSLLCLLVVIITFSCFTIRTFYRLIPGLLS